MKTRRIPDEAGIFAVLVVVVVAFSLLSPNFRSLSNFSVLLAGGSVIAFLALGQAFVLLTGGIDLSTGANIAMTNVLVALFIASGMPWVLATIVAVGAGVLLGVVNGLLVHYVRIPAFIATFGTMGIALAVPLIITGASSIAITNNGFSWVGQGAIADVPIPVLLLIIAAVLAGGFLKMTRPGVHIYALGGNKAAARLAGVNIARTTVLVYAVSGFCGAMGGMISASRLMVGFPATGTGNELFYSIAAAVVGGISLFGGVGTIPGAMIGAVLIAVVNNGMNVINVESYWQSLVIGVIILAGVAFDTFRRTRATKPTPARPPVVPPLKKTQPRADQARGLPTLRGISHEN